MIISTAANVALKPTTFTLQANRELDIPAGPLSVEAMKGFEYQFEKQTVNAPPRPHHQCHHPAKAIAASNPRPGSTGSAATCTYT